MISTKNKRSRQLKALSIEHREGMQFITRLRTGLHTNISIDRMREYTCWYWKNHIRPHFYHEEMILLPYLPANHPLALQLTEEHATIREMILSLDFETDNISIEALCDFIVRHIHFEEDEVFPYLEQTLTTPDLDKIYAQLQARPIDESKCEWEDRFWEEGSC